jgi:hypothetical protein
MYSEHVKCPNQRRRRKTTQMIAGEAKVHMYIITRSTSIPNKPGRVRPGLDMTFDAETLPG